MLPTGARATLPDVSAAVEVTDGHVVGQWVANNEDAIMTRVGNDLYFIYKRHVSPDNEPDEVYVRQWHLNTDVDTNGFTEDAVLVDDTSDDTTDNDHGSYHSEPSLLRDGLGQLRTFVTYYPLVADTFDTYSLAPRGGIIPDLSYSPGWTAGPLDCYYYNDGGGEGSGYTTYLYDVSGECDGNTGVTHFVAEGGNIPLMFGESPFGSENGESRTYYRIDSEGNLDGPYELVRAPSKQPDSFTNNVVQWPYPGATTRPVCPGNTFAKGDLVLGKEVNSAKSLHVMWNIRNTFTASTSGCAYPCSSPCSPLGVQWNYNLYYAKSTDGGDTWTNVSGAAEKDVYGGDHLLSNSNYIAYTGDVDQGSERAFDIKPDGYPITAICTLHSDTGFLVGDSSLHHVNRADIHGGDTPLSYDLSFREWNGSTWTGSVIDDSRNYGDALPKLRVDLDGGVWIFVPILDGNGNPIPNYWYRAPNSGSWSGPTAFGVSGDHPERLYSYTDSADPNYHYIAWVNTTDPAWTLHFRTLKLTANLLPPDTDVPSGTYYTTQSVHLTPAAAQAWYITSGTTIRYTTNGSDPTSGSTAYSSPISVGWNQTVTIKARTFKSGYADGPVRTVTIHVDAS